MQWGTRDTGKHLKNREREPQREKHRKKLIDEVVQGRVGRREQVLGSQTGRWAGRDPGKGGRDGPGRTRDNA